MSYKLIVISLFLVSSLAVNTIYQRCGPCNVRPGCGECLTYQGGPFNNQNSTNINTCVDLEGGCKYRNYTDTSFQFACQDCKVDGWCGYKITGFFQNSIGVWTGCTNGSDLTWRQAKNTLDGLYGKLYGGVVHSWCDGVCDKVTAGQQAVIIFAAVGVASVVFAIISQSFCNRRRIDSAIL